MRAEVKPGIEERGWATKSELRRFAQTANSAEAVGDSARHSPGKFDIPKQPMTLMEATDLIGRLLRHWIESILPINTNASPNVP